MDARNYPTLPMKRRLFPPASLLLIRSSPSALHGLVISLDAAMIGNTIIAHASQAKKPKGAEAIDELRTRDRVSRRSMPRCREANVQSNCRFARPFQGVGIVNMPAQSRLYRYSQILVFEADKT